MVQCMLEARLLGAVPHYILGVKLGRSAGQGSTDAFPVHREEISTWRCPQARKVTRNAY